MYVGRHFEDSRDGARFGQKSLEFRGFGSTSVDGKRSQRYRVHAVSRERPGKLHANRRVRSFAKNIGRSSGPTVWNFFQAHRIHTSTDEHDSILLSFNLRNQRNEEHLKICRRRVEALRYRHFGILVVGMRVVRSSQARLADDISGSFTDDHSYRTRPVRPRTESGDGVERELRVRGARNVPSALLELVVFGVQHVFDQTR